MAGTDNRKTMIADGPAIVLVEPQLGENIGMAARAMANFGLDRLVLVNPREPWPNGNAIAAASKADHVIGKVQVFATLPEALAGMNYVVATTARARDGFKRVLGPVRAAAELRARHSTGQNCAILFGRERFGLFNEEISLADDIVTFPVNPAFASLNIAQAVLLMSYEWMKTGLETPDSTPFSGPEAIPAEKDELYGMFGQLEDALARRGYFRPLERREVLVQNLRSILSRPGFTSGEVRVLRGVVSCLDLFSPENPRGSGAPEGRRKPTGGKRTPKRERTTDG